MDTRQHRSNRIATAGLLLALVALMALVGGVFAGTLGVGIAVASALFLLIVSREAPITWILRSQRARPLPESRAPELHEAVARLARRAGLESTPRLFLTEGGTPNALTVGEGAEASIVLSSGLLRALPPRALLGVLAHEIAHVKNRDTRTLRLAATFNAVVGTLSRAGGIMLLLSLPLVLLGEVSVPLLGVLLLVLGPVAGQALQLALSRQREFAADDVAVALTGDPRGLAEALIQLEARQASLLRWIGLGALRVPEWLRTHPPTQARIERLLGRDSATARGPQTDLRYGHWADAPTFAGRPTPRPPRPSAAPARVVVVPFPFDPAPRPRRFYRLRFQ